jgi:hypothetical protein
MDYKISIGYIKCKIHLNFRVVSWKKNCILEFRTYGNKLYRRKRFGGPYWVDKAHLILELRDFKKSQKTNTEKLLYPGGRAQGPLEFNHQHGIIKRWGLWEEIRPWSTTLMYGLRQLLREWVSYHRSELMTKQWVQSDFSLCPGQVLPSKMMSSAMLGGSKKAIVRYFWCPASRTVRNESILYKLPSLRYSVTAAEWLRCLPSVIVYS